MKHVLIAVLAGLTLARSSPKDENAAGIQPQEQEHVTQYYPDMPEASKMSNDPQGAPPVAPEQQ